MDQDIGKRIKRPKQRRTQWVIGASTQGGSDFGGRQLRTMPCKLIDRASHTSAAQRSPHEHPKTVREDADKVRGHRLDVPARAQARRRQLRIIEVVNQISNLSPLVGDSGKDKLAAHSH